MTGTTPCDDDAAIEAHYRQLFLALFARVQAKHPERGIATLFSRAKKQVEKTGCPYGDALETEYQAAKIRTEKRLALTQQCDIGKPS